MVRRRGELQSFKWETEGQGRTAPLCRSSSPSSAFSSVPAAQTGAQQHMHAGPQLLAQGVVQLFRQWKPTSRLS